MTYTIEIICAIIGTIAAVIGLILEFRKDDSKKEHRTITVGENKGYIKNQSVRYNDQSVHINQIDNRKYQQNININSKSSSLSDGDAILFMIIIAAICILASILLYQYIWILRSVVYVFQLIFIFLAMRGRVQFPGRAKATRLIFALSPSLMSMLYFISMKLDTPARNIRDALEATPINIKEFGLTSFMKTNGFSLLDMSGFTIIILTTVFSWLMLLCVQISIVICEMTSFIEIAQKLKKNWLMVLFMQCISIFMAFMSIISDVIGSLLK